MFPVMYFSVLVAGVVSTAGNVDLLDSWDYNLLVRLNETAKGYDFPGQLIWEGRDDVMELPGRIFNNEKIIELEDKNLTSPCCRDWTKIGWMKVKSKDAEITSPLLDYSFRWNNSEGYPAEIWALQGDKGKMYSPTIPTTIFKYNRNNVTVALTVFVIARISIESTFEVSLEHADGSVQSIGEISGSSENTWVMEKFNRKNTEIQRNTTVRVLLKAKQPKDWITPAMIQWVSISVPRRQKTLIVGTVKNANQLKNTYFSPLTRIPSVLEEDPVCMHGGLIDVITGRCVCLPGFTGTVCEKGCGPNHYGTLCRGQCSLDSERRHCLGVFSCLKETGCLCMAGLEGAFCNETCRPGRYGTNCLQKCGSCAGNDTCDRFTGRCETGCEDGFQPPFCKQAACGIPASGHVDVNEPEVLFWHSAIYEKKNNVHKAVCSASLIAPRFLLSAAWCFFSESTSTIKSPARFSVLFGTEKRYEFTDTTYPQDVQIQRVASIHAPQLYRGSKRSHADDIALVELAKPVRSSSAIGIVCLDAGGDEEEDELLDGDVGYTAGWGSLGTNCTDCTRKGTEIEYLTRTSCLNQVVESLLLAIGPEKFCGLLPSGEEGDKLEKNDPSDIGSGFLYVKNGAWYLYGVKSAAAPDKKHNIAAYTSVRNYAEWIMTTLNDLNVKYAVMKNI